MVEVKNCGPILHDPNAVWNFGERLSVEFHENGMIATLNARKVIPPPGIKTAQTAISVSDTNGVLRFYGGNDDGDGRFIKPPGLNKRVKLWYRDTASVFDFITPRSANEYIKGTGNAFQNLVVNRPGFPKEYWWVTLYNGAASGHLYYRKIALNNGNHYDIKGPANIALQGPVGFPADSGAVFSGEAISAVASANDSFYWMFFLCPSKTGTAFDSTLVIYKMLSDTLTYFNSVKINEPGYGVIKVSPDGRWVYTNSNLYEFNRKTGAILLKHNFYDYVDKRRNATTAAEFSPNSRFLYVARSNNLNTRPAVDSIFQLDLDQKDPYVKRKTIAITSRTFLFLFQRTPDSRIAMIRSNFVNMLDMINEPDSLCSTVNPNNCKFTLSAFNPTIPGRTDMNVNISLPDPVIDLRDKTEMRISYYVDSCYNYHFTHNIPWETGSIWYFGDGNQSTGREVNHIYSAGNYEVLCIIGIDTLRISISVRQKTFSISGRTVTCDSNQFAFYHVNTGNSDLKYDWNVSGGTNTYPSSLNQAYIKWYGNGFVNVVLFDQFDGCVYKDTLFTVSQNSITNNTISGDTLFCSNMISIAGSNPIGGSGSFTYSWLLARNGVEYSLDSFSKSLTYLATKMPYSVGKLYRNVVSNGCVNRSNGLTVIISNQSNKLVVIPDGCSDIITDADTLNRIPGSTYQWQMSTDSFNWSNINGANKAAITVTNKSWPKRFFRRLEYVPSCGYDTSNIQRITGLIYIIEQPVDAAACKNMEFTMNVILNDNRTVASSFRWQYLENINWIDLPINPGGSPGLTDMANRYSHGTTFRLKISNPCFILYSNTAILKKVTDPSFTYLTGDGNLFVKGDTIIPDTSSRSSYRMTAAWRGERNVAWVTWYRSARPEGAKWDSIGATTSNHFADAAPFNLCQKRYFYKVTLRNLCKASYVPTYWTEGDPSKTRYFSVGDESVISPPSAPDLWIRGSYRDLGNEPNWIDSQNYTGSYCLWNRNWSTKRSRVWDWMDRENVQWDRDTNWIHCVIYNKGNVPAMDGKVFFYWTVMSINEDWPYSWTGLAKFKNQDPNSMLSINQTYPLGNRINKTGIDLSDVLNKAPEFDNHAPYGGQLQPGDSVLLSFPWTHADTIPMPGWYYGKTGNPARYRYASTVGMCLLARITTCDSQAQGMTFPEKLNMGTDKPVKNYGNIGYNIVRNNNIASANFYLGYMNPPFSDTVQVWSLGAPPPADSSRGNADVYYTLCGDNPIYFNNGEVQVTLSNEVWQPFAAAGKPGSGFYSVKDNEIVITNPCATIGPISISDTVLPFWGINFRYKPGTYQNGVPISTVFHLKQFKTTGEMVGMCSFGVHSTGMGPGGEGQGEGKPAEVPPTQPSGKVEVYPNPIGNQLLLDVYSQGNERFNAVIYDASGRLVARLGAQKITSSGKNVYSINTTQLPPGVYTVSMRLNEALFTRKIIKIEQ